MTCSLKNFPIDDIKSLLTIEVSSGGELYPKSIQ